MIPFVSLTKQHAHLSPELERVLAGVLAEGDFVLGRRVLEFEEAFAAYCGAGFGIGVNSGTSALHIALLAAGIGPEDEVITTAFTFVATVAAIGYTGARPVLVDIAPGAFTIDPAEIEAAITPRTRAILPVHLYGHPADMDPILDIARRHNLAVIEDAAQAHGAEYKGRRVGGLGDAGCFSFYPTKNLGACGEGGILVTSHPQWAQTARALRDWGQTEPYRYSMRGYNYRMEGMQGAVLGVKLRHLDEWNNARRAHARAYTASIGGGALVAPEVAPWATHVFHIYAVRALDRAAVQQEFHRRGIQTRVHYPQPIHLAEAWSGLGYHAGSFPHAERAAREVLSIPVYPELDATEVRTIATALREVSTNSRILEAEAASL